MIALFATSASKVNNTYNFSVSKLIIIIVISVAYYFMRNLYFPHLSVNWDHFGPNLTLTKFDISKI